MQVQLSPSPPIIVVVNYYLVLPWSPAGLQTHQIKGIDNYGVLYSVAQLNRR